MPHNSRADRATCGRIAGRAFRYRPRRRRGCRSSRGRRST